MKREVKIGIFAVAMILLAWGGVRFLSGLDVLSREVEYVAQYDQVSGVQEASAVVMKGVKIGSVRRIELNPAVSDKVFIHLTVRSSYRIPTDSEARIFSDGLLGGKAVEIIYGTADSYLQEGDTIRSSYDRDLMTMAGSEFEFFKQQFVQLTDELHRTLGNLNRIMEQNAAHVEATMGHVESISGDVADLLTQEKQALATTMENLAAFSSMLGENSMRVDSIISGVNTLVAELEEEAVVKKLASTVEQLNTVMQQINSGEGTVGRLMYDEQLYANLTATSEHLAALLADLKARPARYVHLSLFGKDPEKQQAKAEKRAAKAAAKQANNQ
ncbi:MAG: MCE family protein [Alistipes sp.]|nr:MCE family protein [Alistipes sp.]